MRTPLDPLYREAYAFSAITLTWSTRSTCWATLLRCSCAGACPIAAVIAMLALAALAVGR